MRGAFKVRNKNPLMNVEALLSSEVAETVQTSVETVKTTVETGAVSTAPKTSVETG